MAIDKSSIYYPPESGRFEIGRDNDGNKLKMPELNTEAFYHAIVEDSVQSNEEYRAKLRAQVAAEEQRQIDNVREQLDQM